MNNATNVRQMANELASKLNLRSPENVSPQARQSQAAQAQTAPTPHAPMRMPASERHVPNVLYTNTLSNPSCHPAAFFTLDLRQKSASDTISYDLIKTFDIPNEVIKSLNHGGNGDLRALTRSELLSLSQQLTSVENKFIAKQMAVMVRLTQGDESPQAIAQKINDSALDPEYKQAATSIAHYLETHQFNPETQTFINDSGLTMSAQSAFCPMPNERHTIMRATPHFSTDYYGHLIEGKIYADFLNPEHDLGQTVFPPGDDQSIVTLEDYVALSATQPNYLMEVSMAVQKDALNEFHNALRKNPELIGSEIPKPLFADLKPKLVYTAKSGESQAYIGKCHFPTEGKAKGEFHIELPDIVAEQMNYSEKHSSYEIQSANDLDDEKTLKFIGVMDLGTGDLLMSTHLDRTFHHSTPKGGSPVATAFELDGPVYKNADGKMCVKVTKLVNKSGHYLPPLFTMAKFRDALISSGLDATKTKISTVSRDDQTNAAMGRWNTSSNNPSVLPKHAPISNDHSRAIAEELSVIQAAL